MVNKIQKSTQKIIGYAHFKPIVLSVIIMLSALIISKYMFQLALIDGKSMSPTYHNTNIVIINKLETEYKQGDVVVFTCKSLNKKLVKRIVAVPGDTVIIKNNTLYINNIKYDNIPENGSINYSGLAENTLLLKDNEYFLLGDNINNSIDSRYPEVGIITYNNILGKIIPDKSPR
jgi:signal peptidase I